VTLRGPPAPPLRAPTVNALLALAARHPSGVTFVGLREEEERLAWGDVAARARRAAASLAAAGVEPGDRVALVLRTEPAFLDVFFGALLAGAVPVPLYPPVRLGRLDEYVAATARMVRAAGARLLVSGGAARRLLGEVVAEARPALGWLDAAALPRGRRELWRDAAPQDLALVQFSSGSTVDPKPVALTHGALAAHVAALLALLRPTAADALVSWLPLYHDMGLIGGLLGAMSYPGPAVLIAPEHFLARPALWPRAVARHRGTISAAPSFAYAYAAARVADADLAGQDLSCWRVALDGAEPVSLDALHRFAERFGPHGFDAGALVPVYGLSEAALAVTFAPGRRPWRALGVDRDALAVGGEVREGPRQVASVGVPIPGVEVEVRDGAGAALAERRLGHVFVRSPSLMREYLGQPEATARALRGGWLDTGDLGFVDGGELFVHGRAKDALIVRGANRAPDEFERALDGVAGLRSGCAVAVACDAGDGEGVLVLAERASAGPPDADVAARARRAVLERTGVAPHEVVLLAPGTLPRTSSGKMRRGEARRRWLAGELAPPAAVTPLSLARAMARSAVGYARARAARR
jgi:fatty-acyl-CoA synthase